LGVLSEAQQDFLQPPVASRSRPRQGAGSSALSKRSGIPIEVSRLSLGAAHVGCGVTTCDVPVTTQSGLPGLDGGLGAALFQIRTTSSPQPRGVGATFEEPQETA
jgi:hypothetical protein